MAWLDAVQVNCIVVFRVYLVFTLINCSCQQLHLWSNFRNKCCKTFWISCGCFWVNESRSGGCSGVEESCHSLFHSYCNKPTFGCQHSWSTWTNNICPVSQCHLKLTLTHKKSLNPGLKEPASLQKYFRCFKSEGFSAEGDLQDGAQRERREAKILWGVRNRKLVIVVWPQQLQQCCTPWSEWLKVHYWSPWVSNYAMLIS